MTSDEAVGTLGHYDPTRVGTHGLCLACATVAGVTRLSPASPGTTGLDACEGRKAVCAGPDHAMYAAAEEARRSRAFAARETK